MSRCQRPSHSIASSMNSLVAAFSRSTRLRARSAAKATVHLSVLGFDGVRDDGRHPSRVWAAAGDPCSRPSRAALVVAFLDRLEDRFGFGVQLPREVVRIARREELLEPPGPLALVAGGLLFHSIAGPKDRLPWGRQA